MNIRSVLYILGILTSTLGCMMLFPAIFNFIKHENEWTIFASTGIIIFFIGMTIILAFKSKELKIGNKETFLLTFLSWFILASISALPFYLSNLNLSYTDSFFEATSGITTTGSTIIKDLNDASADCSMEINFTMARWYWNNSNGCSCITFTSHKWLTTFFLNKQKARTNLKKVLKKIATGG